MPLARAFSAFNSRQVLSVLGSTVLLAGAVTALSSTAARGSSPAASGSAQGTSGSASGVETFHATSSSMKIYWRGNGHGHGMSQYGARGAAMKGLTAAQILAFYYPGTKLTTLPASTVRVRLSDATAFTTVLAGTKGLALSGFGALPASGYTQFRLRPSGSGLRLDGRKGSSWKGLKTGLPTRADFSSSLGWVQVLLADGSSTRYRGTVGAVRSGADVLTINRVSLNLYAQGVAPREMPASWDIAAVRAQAIAARSYAKSSMAASGGSSYDICDTTMCQVYGGMAHYDSGGNLQYSDDPDAVSGYDNVVLTYQGAAIFAQYSASNGGATVDGGKPYLVGKTDPYDSAASGDPYLDESDTVSVSSLASSYGLRSISSISVTKRDGHGPWGGRIQTAYVNGTASSGGTKRVATTGFELGDNMGVYTDYLRFDAEPTAPSAPTAVKIVSGDAGARVSWGAPTSTGNSSITGYRVTFNHHTIALSATARSTWVGPLSNRTTTPVSVRAVNATGASGPATVTAAPAAAPAPMVAVQPARLFDTSTAATAVDTAHPFRFAVAGAGSIPKSGVRSVVLTVTVLHPSASGVLTVAASGVQGGRLSAIAYRAGHTAAATVSVPLVPSSTLVFTPTAGHVALRADQQAYTASSGSLLTTADRQQVAKLVNVPTGNGAVVSLKGLSGISSATTGVLLAVDGASAARTWLRIWPDGGAAPTAEQVWITPTSASANTFFVPLTTAHTLRVAAGARGASVRITLLGTLGPTGGRFESFPANPIADGGSARDVDATAVSVPMVGVSQVPATGVNAVLVHVTVTSDGQAGSLWIYPAQAKGRPDAPSVVFAGTGPATATALVRVGPTGKLAVKTSGPRVHVAIDAIGYLTSR